MGKGAGKGECAGKEEFKTEKGKQAGRIAICVLVFESVGALINLYPTCVSCFVMPCGCCWGFSMLASGIAGIIGAAVPSCCKKNVKALHALIGTSAVTLAFRVAMIIVFSIWVNKFMVMLQNYDTCLAADTPLPYPFNYYYDRTVYCEVTYLKFNKDDNYYFTRDTIQSLLNAFVVALVLALVWAIVSIFGIAFGADGAKSEEGARDLEAGSKDEVQVVEVQASSGKLGAYRSSSN
jgi:hypothetical protein